MLKLVYNDTVVKEYEDTTIFVIFNKDRIELINKKGSEDDPDQINNLHTALAFHWALGNNPEIIENLLEAFDNQVTEKIEPATETIQ